MQPLDIHDSPTLPVKKRGRDLLRDPSLNKGTGFADSERDALGLRGLVPPEVVSIDDQVQRALENYQHQTNDLDRYIFLETLHDRNETLYYRILLENIRELTPIIYTPVVGQACQQFGHIYRRARGMYFNVSSQANFQEMVNNWDQDEIDILVVTDGSRILGLGDLGTNGMGIPIGKLSLYVAGAGINPNRTLPVVLDVGTNNTKLRDDILYLGERIPRLTGTEYDKLVADFITAVHKRWPKALIQFEDFSNNHAFALLERYRKQILCFNDDIQGTGAVTLAGILGALRITRGVLAQQRVVIFGAGSAARGIADQIVNGMMVSGNLSLEAARNQIWLIDSKGLVTQDRLKQLAPHKQAFARSGASLPDLLSVIDAVHPSILIGVSGQKGTFTKTILQTMQQHVPRPIVFALSNPTSKSECTAEQAYTWTNGAAIFASGSPFSPVTYKGQVFVPGQCNNMYIFPGVGLGAILSGTTQVSDQMFYAAAGALAGEVTEEMLAVGQLYPDLSYIRDISTEVAAAVCEVAFADGSAKIARPDDLMNFIHKNMYQPEYVPYQAI
ncbi:malate dehydrogenase [Achromatium sp. WMS3]|nr:malate dehydrogenase [Achromatium sp. WMS3]